MTSYKEIKAWVKDNGMMEQVSKYVEMGMDESVAIGMIYDSFHMERDEFKEKYSGK